MALYDGFFDAEYNEETGKFDREYNSEEFTEYFGQIVGSGVCIATDPDSCMVWLEDGQAFVHEGYLFIQGYWLRIKDEPYAVQLSGYEPQAIVAYLNLGKKMIELEARPVAESYPYALCLGIVDPANREVTDTRYNIDICGVIDSAGGLSEKSAFAIDYIDNHIEGRLKQMEESIAEQDKMLDQKMEDAQAVLDKLTPLPVGAIKFSANPDLGEEWLECDGRTINKTEYPDLIGKLLDKSDTNTSIKIFDFDWMEASLPLDINLSDITYGNGIFVAVPTASKDTAIYSKDGVNWIKTTFPKEVGMPRVCYGNGVFVAIPTDANCNVAAWSQDGIKWTLATLPSTGWVDIVYGNGIFVAITGGNAGKDIAAYSENGKVWIKANLPESTSWSGIAYGNEIFVAVAGGYKMSDISAYSRDGINWTQSKLPYSGHWTRLAYGKGRFVATVMTGSGVFYSDDGINWTSASLSPNSDLQDIAYGGGIFVAIGGMFSYSEDGAVWFSATLPPISKEYIAYGSGRFIVAGIGEKIAYCDPFSTAKLPNFSLDGIPAYIKAKETKQ